MKRAIIVILVGVLGATVWWSAERRSRGDEAGPETRPGGAASSFRFVDVFIDSGRTPLAAYEVEFKTTAGKVELVGIEGGDNKDFQDPPYYDPAALNAAGGGRAIIGSFNTTENLPAGKTRVARLHLHVDAGGAKPVYAVTLLAAGSKQGQNIPATVSFSEGESR